MRQYTETYRVTITPEMKQKIVLLISCTRCNQLVNQGERHICRDIAEREWRNKKVKFLQEAGLSTSLINW